MQLEHSFSVPVGIDEAWRVLLDIERIAPCIPGAIIESIDGDEITGAIKVKLGAIGPTYRGTATLAEKDPDGHRAVINAQGDTRANGSATAKVTATLSEFGGSTSVMLMTDVDFTGKPAQLEQAVIFDAGARVVRQFAERLATLLADSVTAEPAAEQPAQEVSSAAEPPARPAAPQEPAAAPQEPAAAPQEPAAAPQEPAAAPQEPSAIQGASAPEETVVVPAARPRPNPRPRASAAVQETPRPSQPGPAATPATPESAAPRHATSPRPHVEVIPDEPQEGPKPLARRLAPFAIVVLLLLLRRRRRRRRR